jgi:hypothetical protein
MGKAFLIKEVMFAGLLLLILTDSTRKRMVADEVPGLETRKHKKMRGWQR